MISTRPPVLTGDELCMTGMFFYPFADGWQDDATSVMLAGIAQEPMLSDTVLVEQRANDGV